MCISFNAICINTCMFLVSLQVFVLVCPYMNEVEVSGYVCVHLNANIFVSVRESISICKAFLLDACVLCVSVCVSACIKYFS